MNEAPSLLHLQRTLQALILQRSANTDSLAIRAQDVEDRAARLQVYTNAYRSRLLDALAHHFPMLQIHLGADGFARLALDYIDAHPSRYVSIRDIGADLSAWLATQRADEPWLAEFARFEWALAAAFDAVDSAIVTTDMLATLTPSEWSSLTFEFAPATQRLTLLTNASQLYRDATQDLAGTTPQLLDAPCEWLIWRHDLIAHYRSIDTLEALALDTLREGRTFADACELLMSRTDDDSVPLQAAGFLKRWLIDGLIASFST